jgi:hypothetical protein
MVKGQLSGGGLQGGGVEGGIESLLDGGKGILLDSSECLERGIDISLREWSWFMMKLLAPVKGCFKVASFKDQDFHGHFVIISCTRVDGMLVERLK